MTASSQYQQALLFEQKGEFKSALALFEELLQKATLPGQQLDRGDLLFHCGWCLEHLQDDQPQRAISCYQEAAGIALAADCRMNSAFRAGWGLMHQKEYVLAEQWFLAAISIHEKNNTHDNIYHNACFWLASTLEQQKQYLKALQWHQKIQAMSPRFSPESRIREIYCLNSIGDYQAALEICQTFEQEPPPQFDRQRYEALRTVARQQRHILERCLAEPF